MRLLPQACVVHGGSVCFVLHYFLFSGFAEDVSRQYLLRANSLEDQISWIRAISMARYACQPHAFVSKIQQLTLYMYVELEL